MSHYEISPREREDEQRRWRDEFDAPEETYDEYLQRTTEQLRVKARLSGTGRSESREEAA